MTLDAILRPLGKSLINQFGKSATITRTIGGTFDPVAGANTGTSEQTFSIKVSPPEKYRRELVDGTVILEDDFKVQVSAIAIEPDAETDRITLDGVTYQIVSAPPVYSGEQAAIYELQCRK